MRSHYNNHLKITKNFPGLRPWPPLTHFVRLRAAFGAGGPPQTPYPVTDLSTFQSLSEQYIETRIEPLPPARSADPAQGDEVGRDR